MGFRARSTLIRSSFLIPLFILILLVGCSFGISTSGGGGMATTSVGVASAGASDEYAEDPLPSWNEGPIKEDLLDFVTRVTREGGPDFVPVPERIAVFDNDGTLWSEKPVYFQLFFVLDRVQAMASEHPEWATTQPFQAVLEGDMEALAESGERGLLELMMATHSGMTTDEFDQIVRAWLAEARHPRFDRAYNELVYQPMLELLEFLRAHGFKTFIVSGGGIDFMRPWTEAVYGIPPEQVVGSSLEYRFVMRDGEPLLVREPELHFLDDKATKPVAIHRFIGRRPIAAFGNSDGDFEMLQWCAAGEGPSLQLYVHHTDEEREWAYDRDSHVGRLDRGLDEAHPRGWLVVDMKRDWARIYSFDSP